MTTIVPTDASTGASITEATGATGYTRTAISAAAMNAASGGSKTNGTAITGSTITAGTASVIGFAICDSATTGAGNVLLWGTVPTTTLSATNQPATVAIGALTVTLD